MRVSKVIFIGKSKKKSGSTRFMLKGLRKRAPRARFLNVPRYRKRYVWSNCKKHIHRRITSYDPDLVLIFSQDIPFEVLEKIKARYLTAIYYHDGYNPPGEKLLRYARQVDYFFLTNKTQIGLFREAGVRNPIFCLEGCDAGEHRRVPSRNRKWAAQVAFIGKPSAPHRVELLKSVNRSFELKAWGGIGRVSGSSARRRAFTRGNLPGFGTPPISFLAVTPTSKWRAASRIGPGTRLAAAGSC